MTFSTESASTTQQPIRRRRRRRLLKEDIVYIPDGDRPTNLDVICGRGGRSNFHEGSRRYLRLVLAERPGFKRTTDRDEKYAIVEAIYDYILSTGGRFLQFDGSKLKWFRVSKRLCRRRISCLLRDKYVPDFIKKERELISAPPPPSTPSSSVPTEDDWRQVCRFLSET